MTNFIPLTFLSKKFSGKEKVMRPLERKLLQKITDKGITFDDVLELLDKTSKHEMNKNFQDDCLFQTNKYFAKLMLDSLLKYRLIKKEGNKYYKVEQEKEKTPE